MVESFWAIPDVADLRTPLSILREQAAALTAATKGVLVGAVETERNGDELLLRLDIIVPALNDYRYQLMSYRQTIHKYPGLMYAFGTNYTINDESHFITSIKRTLASTNVKNVLTSLLSQARIA